jgi:hypothetical protein
MEPPTVLLRSNSTETLRSAISCIIVKPIILGNGVDIRRIVEDLYKNGESQSSAFKCQSAANVETGSEWRPDFGQIRNNELSRQVEL